MTSLTSWIAGAAVPAHPGRARTDGRLTPACVFPYHVSQSAWDRFQRYLLETGMQRVVEVPTYQRLKDVSHFGLLGWFRPDLNSKVATSKRFEHSVAVGFCGYQFAEGAHLSADDTAVLVLAALLHDVAHIPFSHSLEPAFRLNGWDHNRESARVSAEVLGAAGVAAPTAARVARVLDREDALWRVLFGPAGIDAQENALRMRQLIAAPTVAPACFWAVMDLRGDPLSEFLREKTWFYAHVFLEDRYQLFERLLQGFVLDELLKPGGRLTHRVTERTMWPLQITESDVGALLRDTAPKLLRGIKASRVGGAVPDGPVRDAEGVTLTAAVRRRDLRVRPGSETELDDRAWIEETVFTLPGVAAHHIPSPVALELLAVRVVEART